MVQIASGREGAARGPASLPEGEIQRVAFSSQLLDRVVHGEISDQGWRAEVARSLATTFGQVEADAAVREWSISCGLVVPEVLALLRRISPAVRLVLATNATSRLGDDLRTLGLSDTFHALANSSVIGAAKPEPEYFEAALALAGVTPSQALFVDDTPQNVNASEALGIRSHCDRNSQGMEQFLASSGVLLEA